MDATDAPDPFDAWPAGLVEDLRANGASGRVGSVLVSETGEVRVWHLTLAPGERTPFHRHVLDYFWTVLCDGRSRSYFEDGSVRDAVYRTGDTRHFAFAPGRHMTHNLENTGAAPLTFVTVERKGGGNAPLPLAP